MSEKIVKIVKSMYESRQAALSLLGSDEFKVKVSEYQPFILGTMREQGCNEIVATTALIETIVNQGYDGMPVMLMLAACVELLEPPQELP